MSKGEFVATVVGLTTLLMLLVAAQVGVMVTLQQFENAGLLQARSIIVLALGLVVSTGALFGGFALAVARLVEEVKP